MDKELLKNNMKKEAKEYDFIVVDDCYCDNPHVWGSNASYSSLKMGGGKFAIIDSGSILYDNIIYQCCEYNLDEFVDLIIKHWEERN